MEVINRGRKKEIEKGTMTLENGLSKNQKSTINNGVLRTIIPPAPPKGGKSRRQCYANSRRRVRNPFALA